MSIELLMKAAVEEGVYLFIKNDLLAFRVSKSGMSDTLKTQLKQNKAQIEQFLRQSEQPQSKVRGLNHQLPALVAQPNLEKNPLSFSQKRLWFIDQLNQGSSEYNLPVALSLRGKFNLRAFKEALSQLIDRHEILRTVYMKAPNDDQVQQQMRPVGTAVHVEEVDLSGLGTEQQSATVDELSEQQARLCFNLAEDLMLRTTVIKLEQCSHVVLFTMHHIASDGWSMNLMIREFSACYQANCQSLPDPLPSLLVQYRDFAQWQSQWLQGELLERGLHYWQQKLAGIAPVHSLALDFARPLQQQHEGANYRQNLPSSLVAKIGQLCKAQSVTQFMLLQSAFSLLISRFSHDPDVVMGTPVAGRIDPNLADLIGFFINNLVLRTDCSGDLSFNQLLARNKLTIVDAFEFQYLPFDVLVEHFNPERNLSHDPIFQIVFGLNNNDSTILSLEGLSITELPGKRVGAKVELEIAVTPNDDGLTVDWTYNTALFKASSIENMANSFAMLLNDIVQRPDTRCHELAMMSLNQRQQLVLLGQNEPQAPIAPMLLIQQLTQMVQTYPDAQAVVCAGECLSYAQLDALSSRLAAYCQEMEIVQGARVGLYLPRSIAQLVGLLGVMKAGASYVPLEPGLPADRLLFMVKDAGIELVLLPADLMGSLKLVGVDVLLMDDILNRDWLGEYANGFEPGDIDEHDEAYVLYTSGSSGRPKGVSIVHAALGHYLSHAVSQYMHEHIEGSVVSSPLCFDATITSLLAPLCVGKSVHLLDDGDAALAQLPQYLFDVQHSWLFKLTPAHLDALVFSGDQGVGRHCIVIGGEQLNVSTLKQWKGKLLPQTCFINEYGPTETVVGTSVFWIETAQQLEDLEGHTSVPIGKPIAAAQLFVVGQNEQLQPLNSTGELYIGGPGVGQGYINLAEQTQSSFVEFAGQRVYRTGDLVRWLPSGELEFIGRRDEQVKIRGYRIELSEISQQLVTLPEVAEAFTKLIEQPNQDTALAAYVVAEKTTGEVVDEQALFEHCRRHLSTVVAQYMVPEYFVMLEQLPLTINGKVDSRALAVPALAGEQANHYVPPATELEQLLCDIWTEAMSLEQVGIEDNFFSLGGDSIRSIKVVSLLAREGIHIDIKTIFSHQSIAQLVAFIESTQSAAEQVQVTERFELLMDRERSRVMEQFGDTIEDAYPLSTLQSGMVFHTQMENFNGIYHDVNAEHLQCRWDPQYFSQAVQMCVDRHPILRTGFDLSGERALQVVYRQVALPLVVEDIRELDEAAQQQHISQWIQQRRSHVFDWLNGPLLQINIFLRDEVRFEFVISFHHSVLDGWSRASLSTELYQYYQQLLAGENIVDRTVEPAAKWIYRQYISLELAALENDAAGVYFDRMLEDAPVLQLPLLADSDSTPMAQGHYVVPDFADQGSKLIALARRQQVPVQVILLSAHLKVLATVSGQRKVISCVVNNGRPEQAGGDTGLGLFLNSLPLALSLFPGSWLQLIDQVTNAYFNSLEYRHYPLARIQKRTGLEFSEVLFNYTHFHVFSEITNQSQSSTIAVLDSSGYEQTNFDFQVDVAREPDGDAMHLSFTYDQSLYSDEQIEKIGRYYVNAFEQLSGDLSVEHFAQGLLSAPERSFLLEGIHNTPAHSPPEGTLVRLFDEQVVQRPNAVAVIYEQQSVTYAELNARANKLAHYLIANGVVADTLVGLSVPRTLEMVMGIVAILKAGGAYLPLDPAYPSERLSYMIENSQLKLIVALDETPYDSENDPALAGVTRIDLNQVDLSAYSSSNPNVDISSDQLAYVIYTSGSTGQPKGVMVEHGNVHRLLSACQQDFNFNDRDVWCLFHSYAFDFSVWELWGALAFGGKLVVVPQWLSRSPEDFYQLVCQQKVTVLNQTPTAFIQFNQVDAEQCLTLDLRAVVFGGEALNLSELQGWVARHGDDKPMLVNMYGITETTVHVTFRRLLKNDIEANCGSLIGRALSDLNVLVLDDDLQPVPLGTSGEMFVGGRGVTRGYLHQRELTDSRFIDDPHHVARKLYRTGDLARYLPSGELEYQGRIDEQVKIRGFRIELAEIEQHLSAQAYVDSTLVLVKDDHQQSKQLVAYFKAQATSTLSDTALVDVVRRHLQRSLPAHMVPAVFVVVAQWPLTANGKVDKKALPQAGMTVLQAEYVAPKNALQQLLCDIWQNTLGLPQVGIEDNFFNIGGDSILSIQIVAALKLKGFELSIRQLFEQQSIKKLSQVLAPIHVGQGEVLERVVEPFEQLSDVERSQFGDDVEDAYPLSNLQAGMVFHTQLAGFNGIYHDIMAEHIKCPWQQQYFTQALGASILRHPVLRSGFILTGQRALQQVFKQVTPPLVIEDLRDRANAEQVDYIAQWTEQRKTHEFCWLTGPLFQINIFLRSNESFEFVISFHHAILDGWSRAVFSTQLYNDYEKLLSGAVLEPVTPEWIYRDFIALETADINNEAIKDHFDRMLSAVPMRQIPHKLDADIEATRSQKTCVLSEVADLSSALMAQARAFGVPVQAVLLAVHFKVLSLLSGESQAVSCVTHNGRPEVEGAELGLGLYLNSLPLGLKVGDLSWTELVTDVAELSAKNLAYRRYPLAQIQKELGFEFSEVTFNYTHFHIYAQMTDSSDSTFELLESNAFERTNFDFHVDISRALEGDELSMVIHYNANLFTAAQISCIGDYYVRAFKQLLANPQARHFEQSLLSQQQLDELDDWGQTPALAAGHSMIWQFARQARQHPLNCALVCAQIEISYDQLDKISSRLAGYLQDMDIVQNSRVGLYLPRGIEQVVAILAVSKVGASYVPLEPGTPAARLEYMVADSALELVLLPSNLMGTIALTGVDVLFMDDILNDTWLVEFEFEAKFDDIDDQTEAYLLYTSGSSGMPKGVRVHHGGLSHYLAHAQTDYIDANIKGSVVSSPLCFDATVTSLLTPLCVGKCVHLLSDGDEALNELPDYLFNTTDAWLFKLTPAHLDALIYSKNETQQSGNVRHCIVVGGEQLSCATLANWKNDLLPNSRFVNEYGPTETVVGTSVYCVDTQAQLQALSGQISVPIGKPIAGSQLFVVGPGEQILPVNSLGELYIAGAGISQGYVNLAEQTSIAFGQFHNRPVYKTGDLVRWLPNGELAFIGRRDSQVKIRGYRIELAEVNQQLLNIEPVSAAFATISQADNGEPRIVAYIVAAPWFDSAMSVTQVTEQCSSHLGSLLPEYMIPTDFVLLAHMPLTTNGKVDTSALPAPEQQGQTERQYIAPRTVIERKLCQVFEQVMEHPRVGVEDNFFSIGGDSIRSIRVVSLLRREGIEIDIKALFDHQSVSQLVKHIGEHAGQVNEQVAVKPFELLTPQELQHCDTEFADLLDDAYPLSTLQSGMVFHTQLESFNGIYHDLNAEHLKCPWDQSHFETALASCIDAHPVLRTSYDLSGERALQLVHRHVDLPLVIEDIRFLNDGEQRSHIELWTQRHKLHVFDWLNGPLFQINIFLRSEASFEFVISFHHSVLDGWSRASLTTKLYSQYERLLTGQPMLVDETDWVYRQFIALELEAINSEAAKQHFVQMMDEVSILQLPQLQGLSATQEKRHESHPLPAFHQRSGEFITLAKTLGKPVSVVLLAVHMKVLSVFSAKKRVTTCVVSHGRPGVEGGDEGIGMFLNSLPMSINMADESWLTMIERIDEINRANVGHRHYPLAFIQQKMDLELSEVLFNYTHFHVFDQLSELENSQDVQVLGSSGFEQTNFDFYVDVSRFGDEMQLNFKFDANIYSSALVERIGQYYVEAMDSLLEDINQPHQQAVLMTDKERQLLEQWTLGQQMPVPGSPLHLLFTRQAAVRPNAVACQDEHQICRYGQLEVQSNQLARLLIAQGVGCNAIVGVSLAPKVELLVVLLGILKAGCAFLPLDPSYPADRLAYMVKDSKIKLMICDDADHTSYHQVQRVGLGMLMGQLHQFDDAALNLSVAPNSMAYMIYTSGSTGLPKGVVISHNSANNFIVAMIEAIGINQQPSGRWLLLTSLAFDISLFEWLGALSLGKTVLVASKDCAADPFKLKTLLQSVEVELIQSTPSRWRQLLGAKVNLISPLYALCGGEALDSKLAGQLLDQDVNLFNCYGPTEATVWSMVKQVTPSDLEYAVVPLGCSLANYYHHVLNSQGQLVPIGSEGELYIGGVSLAEGYFGQEALTAERFIFDAVSRHESTGTATRLYNTGDLVRFTTDGELVFLGRTDDQVKLRGHRMELAEIEHLITTFTGVEDCAVVIRGEGDRALLTAFYTLAEEADIDADWPALLTHYLSRKLPIYMVPSVVTVLDSLPQTPNGKVDKKALPDIDTRQTPQTYEAPQSPLQWQMAELWADMLKRDKNDISLNDDFFELGGNSLILVRMLEHINQRFGVKLEFAQLFESRTLVLLSEQISLAQRTKSLSIDDDDELNDNEIESII